MLGEELEVYLFGNYVRGDWLRDSDLDLIVVSPRFRGMELGRRYAPVRELLSANVSVELLLYTLEEDAQEERNPTRRLRVLDKASITLLHGMDILSRCYSFTDMMMVRLKS